MKTFIISLTEQQRDLGLARPFLYQLHREDRIQFIFHRGDLKEKLEQAALDVQKALSVQSSSRWSVLFLMSSVTDGENPVYDSVAAKWTMIKRYFLEAIHGFAPPERKTLFFLDHTHRSPTRAFDEESYIEQCLEFDRTGMVSNREENLIPEVILEELNRIWDKGKIDTKNENVSQFNEITPRLRERVQKTIARLEDVFINALDKADTSHFLIYEKENISLLPEEKLNKIKNDFQSGLLDVLNHPQRWDSFSPKYLVRRLLRNYLSLNALENHNQFLLIRFPLNTINRNARVFGRLKLALVLNIVLKENRIIEELEKNLPYHLEVELDEPQVKKLAGQYRNAMEYFHESPPKKRNTPGLYRFELLEEKEAIFQEKIPESNITPIVLSLFRDWQSDYSGLDTWLEKTKTKLEELTEAIPRVLKKSYQKNIQAPPEPILVEMDNEALDTYHRDLKKRYEATQKKLKHLNPGNTVLPEFKKKIEQNVPILKKLLLRRPNFKEVIYIMITSILVINLPLIMGLIYGGSDIFTKVAGFVLIGNLLTIGGILYYTIYELRREIRKRQTDLHESAQNAKRQLLSGYEQQKEYLSNLLHLNILRQNNLKIEKLKSSIRENEQHLEYHLQEVEQHYELANQLLKNIGGESDPFLDNSKLEKLTFHLNQPLHKNPIYMPETYLSGSSHPVTVQIHLAQVQTKTPFGSLLKTIKFEDDKKLISYKNY